MNTGEGEAVLRAADREEIERAARALRREPSFVVLAGPSWLEAKARDALREGVGAGWTILSRSLEDPDQTPQILARIGEEPDRTVTWLVLPADPETARNARMALNLHREKLLRPGARSALWLDGHEGFQQFLVAAPDAFSFRSRASVLQGERILPLPEGPEGEPESLRAARAAVAAAQRAGRHREAGRRLVALGWELLRVGRLKEAERAGEDALAHFGPARNTDRARALQLVADTGMENPVRESKLVKEVLGCLPVEPSRRDDVTACLYTWSNIPGPPGMPGDIGALSKAASVLRRNRQFESAQGAPVYGKLAEVYMQVRDLPKAMEFHAKFTQFVRHERDTAMAMLRLARIASTTGSGNEAAQRFLAAADAFARRGDALMASEVRIETAGLQIEMGETELARRLLADSAVERVSSPRDRRPLEARSERSHVLLSRVAADLATTFKHLDVVWNLSLSSGLPTEALNATRLRFESARDFVDAGLLPPSRLDDLDADLSRAETLVVAMAGDDPPWFPILFHQLRAEHLAHRPARLQDAIALLSEALAWCTADSEDLHPKAARLLGAWLLEAGDARRALDILGTAEEIANEDHRHVLGERARILGVATRAMAALGEDPASAWAETRRAVDRTGSKIVEAEVLEDLGTHLPLDLPAPSPLDLLSQARTLFAAMPWPEREGRCLEALAQRQSQQGRVPEARRQLRRALNLYQAHHLRLCEMRAERRFAGVFDTPSER